MCGPCVCSGVPYTHEVLAASMNKQRDWSIRLVTNDAEILAFWIDWPPLHLCKSMRCGKTHGVLDLRIVPNLDGGIVPPIETMAYIASIAQRNVLFENGGTGRQSQFDRPFHSINPVDIPYCDRCAAILVACIGEIHRRHGDPIVGNRKVKLDSECSPGSAITDPGLFDGRVGIEHRLPADFVYARINMSAQIRQDGTFQILVFKINCAPLVFRAPVRDFLPHRIGVVKSATRKLVERRIGIWRPLFVCWQVQNTFPHAHLSPNRNAGKT